MQMPDNGFYLADTVLISLRPSMNLVASLVLPWFLAQALEPKRTCQLLYVLYLTYAQLK